MRLTPFTDRRAIAAALFAVALAGCSTAAIVVPAGLDATTPLPVRGLNPRYSGKPIDFGAYRAAVHEGWQSSRSVELLGISVGKAMRPYRLELAGGDAPVSARCVAAAAEIWRGDFSVELPVDAVLACEITTAAAAWELHLNAGRKGDLLGTLRIPHTGSVFDVRSLHELAGAAWKVGDPVGYELARDRLAVAAAETINTGRVWIPAALAPGERDAVAAALAALLLFTPAEVH